MAAIVNPVLGIEPALLWMDGRRRRSILDNYGYMGVANIFLIFFSDLDRFRIRNPEE
jgi:hypothetical protein